MNLKTDPRYKCIAKQFQPCLDQIQTGKGMERHGTEEDFKQQLTWKLAGLPFFLGQMIKKAYESERLPHAEKVKEITGAINYGLMYRMWLEERG
jgi:hypothetical protein